MEGSLNLLFISWWYGEAITRFWLYLVRIFIYLHDLFSVDVCLRTLFSVWRRDFVYYDGLTLQEKIQAWSLNSASRLVGFIVKVFTLGAYILATTGFALLALLLILAWLGLPIILLVLIYFGIRYIGAA